MHPPRPSIGRSCSPSPQIISPHRSSQRILCLNHIFCIWYLNEISFSIRCRLHVYLLYLYRLLPACTVRISAIVGLTNHTQSLYRVDSFPIAGDHWNRFASLHSATHPLSRSQVAPSLLASASIVDTPPVADYRRSFVDPPSNEPPPTPAAVRVELTTSAIVQPTPPPAADRVELSTSDIGSAHCINVNPRNLVAIVRFTSTRLFVADVSSIRCPGVWCCAAVAATGPRSRLLCRPSIILAWLRGPECPER